MAVEQKPDHQQAWQNAILMLGEAGKFKILTIAGLVGMTIFPRLLILTCCVSAI